MTALARGTDLLFQWLDLSAATLVSGIERLLTRQPLRLVETLPGRFRVEADRATSTVTEISEAELTGKAGPALRLLARRRPVSIVLHPSRFVFRTIEVPGRAREFINGIVRSQIDRLTPWNAADAVFGCLPPTIISTEQIAVTVAATARRRVAAFVSAASAAGAEEIVIYTTGPTAAPEAGTVRVYAHKIRSIVDVGHTRRVLGLVLTASVVAAMVVLGMTSVSAVVLGERQAELRRTLAARRATLQSVARTGADPATLARQSLERRKHERTATVLVMEALARVLPDHSFVTELRIENDMVRITGFTGDAPGLIRLVEQAPEFSQVTFYAPTTRAPSDPGERYHIQARIEPPGEPPS